MKTAKRLLALALAGVMTLALLTGCADQQLQNQAGGRVFPLSNENETK